MKLKTTKSYGLVSLLGLVAGIITRLSDFMPYDTLWSFSSIATLFGFWIVTVTLIIYYSSSNIKASINTFLYLFIMSFSFYLLKYILGIFLPRFSDESFQYNLFLLYAMFSIVCAVAAYVLYFWNKESKISSVLYALPIGALAAEVIGVGLFLLKNGTFLFQFIFNLLGMCIIGIWFYKKANNKTIYIVTIGLFAVLIYVFIYMPYIG